MDVVLLFPGQGSQKPGMGKDLVDAFPAARDVFERADAALGFVAEPSVLRGAGGRAHAHAQRAAGAARARRRASGPRRATRSARASWPRPGTRSASSRRITRPSRWALEDAVRLVRRRGELMYESGVKRPGAMAAILGDIDSPDRGDLRRRPRREAGLVVPANYNCPGQLVISGEEAGRRARDGAVQGRRRQARDSAQRERRVSLAAHGKRFRRTC